MNKVVLVTRKTRLNELVYKYNTIEQARFYIEHMGADFTDYVREDEKYQKSVKEVMGIAEKYARVQQIDRDFLPNMIFGEKDIVIAVGQDGLVANAMKYLQGQPLIGVNPDPLRWDGVLLPFEPGQVEMVLLKAIAGNYAARQVTMAQATTQDGQTMLAVNDLFIGQRTHVSARYDIMWNRKTEHQSSSGIIVSTGLGSTGWYKSIITQAAGIAREFVSQDFHDGRRRWDDDELTFVVREPFPSRSTQAEIVYGRLGSGDSFRILSKMPGNGVVFSDGIESDAIEFNSGTEVTIRTAPQKGVLVV
ncbi:MAG: sugar kinase [Lachnospiraceae bacterium]|nr:sugar kinase [Lachnospiraceae bacterium]